MQRNILRGDVKYKMHLTLKVEKFKNRLLELRIPKNVRKKYLKNSLIRILKNQDQK